MASDEVSRLEALRQDHQALLKLVQALVIVLVVLSASLNVFLLREVTLVRGDLAQRRRVVDDYNLNHRARVEAFLSALEDFSKTDPGFARILESYLPPADQTVSTDSNLPAPLESPGLE